MPSLSRATMLAAVLACMLGAMRGAAAQEFLGADDCTTLQGGGLADQCREMLADNARANDFLRLGQELVDRKNFALAVKVYRRGLQLHEDNAELRAQLAVAESGLKEKIWIEAQPPKPDGTTFKVDKFKCTQLAKTAPQTALKACEAALAMAPDDAELLEAKGDALMKSGRNAEAYLAFAAAARQGSGPELSQKLSVLAQYKPKPAPAPEPKTKPEPAPEQVAQKDKPAPAPETEKKPESDQSESPVDVASVEPPPAPAKAPDKATAADQDAQRKAEEQRKATLIRIANARDQGLGERLRARNTLASMARQAGSSGN